MNDSDPKNRRTKLPPKIYVLTGDDLTLQQDTPGPAAPAETKRSWGSPLLWTSLLLALLAYYIDAGRWVKSAEAAIDRRQKSVACAPYRAWVAQHHLSYAEVAADPIVWTGKPVLWRISRGPDGTFHCGSDATQKIFWSNPAASELAGLIQTGGPQKVLAVIESSESSTPLLIPLEVEK
jgi:hypothetical protein